MNPQVGAPLSYLLSVAGMFEGGGGLVRLDKLISNIFNFWIFLFLNSTAADTSSAHWAKFGQQVDMMSNDIP